MNNALNIIALGFGPRKINRLFFFSIDIDFKMKT